MKSKELKQWLNNETAVLYGASKEAAEYIKQLESIIVSLPSIKGSIHIQNVDTWNHMRDMADDIQSENRENTRSE